ncbi:MAG: GDSL-type esterase/lipase family protein [Vicinamibacteria bacterium]
MGALLLAEAAFRVLDIKATEPGRILRISNGSDVLFPGRAGHTVIDLYPTNPRGSFPIDLTSNETRARLIAEGFTRVDEARKTNPFGVVFKYNTRGFREREFAPKSAGTKRVVFVGDSFTEGMGVREPLSSVRLTEGLLRRQEASVEAFNLGVRALDFPQLEELIEPALELSPDVVILVMVLNDAVRDRELTSRWPRVNDWIMVRQKTPTWIERHSFLAGFLANRYENYLASRDATAWYRSLYSEENRDGWMSTRASLGRIRKKLADRGIPFGVALWPLLVGLEPDRAYPFDAAHAQIKKGVERSGIPFLDLLPALKGRDSASLWVHPSDLHPNEIAQDLVAPVLAEFAHLRLLEAANRQPVAK